MLQKDHTVTLNPHLGEFLLCMETKLLYCIDKSKGKGILAEP